MTKKCRIFRNMIPVCLKIHIKLLYYHVHVWVQHIFVSFIANFVCLYTKMTKVSQKCCIWEPVAAFKLLMIKHGISFRVYTFVGICSVGKIRVGFPTLSQYKSKPFSDAAWYIVSTFHLILNNGKPPNISLVGCLEIWKFYLQKRILFSQVVSAAFSDHSLVYD